MLLRPLLPRLCYPCPLTPAHFNDAALALRPALLLLALAECQHEDAENCVQTAVLNALLNLSRFCAKNDAWPSDLARWLRRILANVLADFHRTNARRGEIYQQAYQQAEAAKVIEAAQAREAEEALSLHDELYTRLESVPLTYLQEDCIRAWMGGQTLREIGETMNLSHVMVKYHIDAAANRLRRGGEEVEISHAMWLLFMDCANHATYTKPAGIWPDWMQQHPPDINLTAWIRRRDGKKLSAAGGRTP